MFDRRRISDERRVRQHNGVCSGQVKTWQAEPVHMAVPERDGCGQTGLALVPIRGLLTKTLLTRLK